MTGTCNRFLFAAAWLFCFATASPFRNSESDFRFRLEHLRLLLGVQGLGFGLEVSPSGSVAIGFEAATSKSGGRIKRPSKRRDRHLSERGRKEGRKAEAKRNEE